MRLAVQPDGSLKAVSFFTPYNAKELSEKDLDFASSGIAALNDEYFGTLSFPHLAVTAGKEGYVYLLNREELGGFQQGLSGGDKVIQKIGPYGGVWSRPGVWPGEGGWIYIPTSYAGGVLRVYKYGVSGSGEPTLSLQGTSSDAFGFGTSAAVITSRGTTAGTALVSIAAYSLWFGWTLVAIARPGELRLAGFVAGVAGALAVVGASLWLLSGSAGDLQVGYYMWFASMIVLALVGFLTATVVRSPSSSVADFEP